MLHKRLLLTFFLVASVIVLNAQKFNIIDTWLNPLYSWKSEVNSMNVCWVVGCKAGNPDLGILKFGLCNKSKFVGIP